MAQSDKSAHQLARFSKLSLEKQLKLVVDALEGDDATAMSLYLPAFIERYDPGHADTPATLAAHSDALRGSSLLDLVVEKLAHKAPALFLGYLRMFALLEGCEEEVYACDAVARVVTVLEQHIERPALLVSALKLLANLTQDDAVRDALVQEEGLLLAVARVMERHSADTTVQAHACLLLANLAVDSLDNKEAVCLECTPAALQALRAHAATSHSVCLAALYLLKNLATNSTREIVDDLVTHHVVDALLLVVRHQQQDEALLAFAIDVLIAVLHENAAAKRALAPAHLTQLVALLGARHHDADAALPVLIVLLQLAKLAEHRAALAREGAVPIVCALLRAHLAHAALAQIGATLLERLCATPACVAALRVHEDVPLLLQLLTEHADEAGVHLPVNRLLFRLTRDEIMRAVIKDSGGISALVTSMNNHDGRTKRFACEAMNALFAAPHSNDEDEEGEEDEDGSKDDDTSSPRSDGTSASEEDAEDDGDRGGDANSPRSAEESTVDSDHEEEEEEEVGHRSVAPRRIHFSDSEGESDEQEGEDDMASASTSASEEAERSDDSASASASDSDEESAPSLMRSLSTTDSPSKDEEDIVAWALKRGAAPRARVRMQGQVSTSSPRHDSPRSAELHAARTKLAEKKAEREKEQPKQAWQSAVDAQYHELEVKKAARIEEEQRSAERMRKQLELEAQRQERERVERERLAAEEEAQRERERARMARLQELEAQRAQLTQPQPQAEAQPQPQSPPPSQPRTPWKAAPPVSALVPDATKEPSWKQRLQQQQRGKQAPLTPPNATPSMPEWQQRLLAKKHVAESATTSSPSQTMPQIQPQTPPKIPSTPVTSEHEKRPLPVPPMTPPHALPPRPLPTPSAASPSAAHTSSPAPPRTSSAASMSPAHSVGTASPLRSAALSESAPWQTPPRSLSRMSAASAAAQLSMRRTGSGRTLPRSNSRGSAQGSPRAGSALSPISSPDPSNANAPATAGAPSLAGSPSASPSSVTSPRTSDGAKRRVSWRKPDLVTQSASPTSRANAAAAFQTSTLSNSPLAKPSAVAAADASSRGAADTTLPEWKRRLMAKKSAESQTATTAAREQPLSEEPRAQSVTHRPSTGNSPIKASPSPTSSPSATNSGAVALPEWQRRLLEKKGSASAPPPTTVSSAPTSTSTASVEGGVKSVFNMWKAKDKQ